MSMTTVTGTTTIGVSLTSTTALDVTVVNNGTIDTRATTDVASVSFSSSGAVLNGTYLDNTGLIESHYSSIVIPGPIGYVHNFGTIQSNGGVAVNLGDDSAGTIINGASSDRTAQIYGDWGGVILGNGAVTNYGTIESGSAFAASNYGVALLGGTQSSTLINEGLIEGANGILAGAGVTVENAGTIIATGALDLAANMESGSTLVIDGGSVFEGTVTATAGAVLEFAPGFGYLNLNSSIDGFMTFAFATSTVWTLEGDSQAIAAGQDFEAFDRGDTLILDGFTATSETYVAGSGLELSDGTSSVTLNITLTPAWADSNFIVQDVASGTEISLCFLPGTHILT